MAREAATTDFDVTVEGIGAFRFAKRTMRDQLAVEVEFSRIIDGVEPTEWLRVLAGWLAVLRVLTVLAPSSWNLDNMDPLDAKTYDNLRKVHKALSDKEADFRGGPKQAEQASGQAVVNEPGVLVSP